MPLASQTAESKFMVERGVTGCDSGLSRRSLPKELLLVQGPQICCPGDKASLYHLCHSDPFTAFLSVLTLLIHWTGASRVYRVHSLLRGNARHEPVRSVCSESPTQFYAEDVTHPHHPVQPSPPVWCSLCTGEYCVNLGLSRSGPEVRSR